MVTCPADDKCFVAVRCEGVSSFRVYEDHSSCAERGYWRLAPVEGAVQLLVRGSSTWLAGGAEHVECVLHLWQHFAPQLDRAIVVQCCDVRDDVVLRCFDCRLCCVGPMVVALHIVSRCTLADQEVLDGAGAFVVQDMELWLVSCCF